MSKRVLSVRDGAGTEDDRIVERSPWHASKKRVCWLNMATPMAY